MAVRSSSLVGGGGGGGGESGRFGCGELVRDGVLSLVWVSLDEDDVAISRGMSG